MQGAWGSEPGPGCSLPLSGGPFRQGRQTVRGSQPLFSWEQHWKKQLLESLSLSPERPERPLPLSRRRPRGLEGTLSGVQG